MNTQPTPLRTYLRQGVLLVLTCAVLLAVMFLVRTYAFTIFSDSSTGERVIVNRLDHETFRIGERVVFQQDNTPFIGEVTALPGDTVELNGSRYLVPQRCVCNGTDCDYCRYYLVKTSKGAALVNHHRMMGKAYRLLKIDY